MREYYAQFCENLTTEMLGLPIIDTAFRSECLLKRDY
jgi:hypothetical protein